MAAFVGGVAAALSSIRALSEATYDVRKENNRRTELITQLEQLQKHLSSLKPIQRLKTDLMRDAVSGLQQTVIDQLQQLTQLREVPRSGPGLWWRILATCICGPNHATRTVKDAAAAVLVWTSAVQQQTPDALDASNVPLVKQAFLGMQVPKHFQPPVTTLASLKALVLSEAAAAPAGGPPRVVQLLGMPGMGKSTLALALAAELETEGVFTGGVYFLVDDFRMEDPTVEEREAITNKVILNLQQNLLDKLCWSELSAGVCSPVILHSRINYIFRNILSSRTHLVVLDDVFDTAIVRQLCFEQMRGVVLVTARVRMRTDAPTIYLQPTPDTRAAARLLFEACAGCVIDSMRLGEKGAAEELLKVYGGNMLAAHICGSHLRQGGKVKSLTDLLRGRGPPHALREPEDYYKLLRKRGTSLEQDILEVKKVWAEQHICDSHLWEPEGAAQVSRELLRDTTP